MGRGVYSRYNVSSNLRRKSATIVKKRIQRLARQHSACQTEAEDNGVPAYNKRINRGRNSSTSESDGDVSCPKSSRKFQFPAALCTQMEQGICNAPQPPSPLAATGLMDDSNPQAILTKIEQDSFIISPSPATPRITPSSQPSYTSAEWEIRTALEILKHQQQQILLQQQQQQELILLLLQKMNSSSSSTVDDTADSLDLPYLFPVTTVEDVMKIEEDVQSNPDLRKKLITSLGLIGGLNTKETVWRIMTKLFANQLAKSINWKGVNGKQPFHSLKLREIVNNAVRKNSFTSHATDEEVECYVIRWLQLAADREGGRRERGKKTKNE